MIALFKSHLRKLHDAIASSGSGAAQSDVRGDDVLQWCYRVDVSSTPYQLHQANLNLSTGCAS